MTPTSRKITRTGITVVEIAEVNMVNTLIRRRHREVFSFAARSTSTDPEVGDFFRRLGFRVRLKLDWFIQSSLQRRWKAWIRLDRIRSRLRIG
jgi:hypothetical protein